MGSATRRSARSRDCDESPPPSFPTTSASLAGDSTVRPIPRRRRRPTRPRSALAGTTSSSSQVPVRQGWRKCAPIPLRTTLAFHRSTVPGREKVAVTPKATDGAQHRADVSGVLDGIQNEDPKGFLPREVAEALDRNGRDRQNPLRGVRLGGALELLGTDLFGWDSRRPQSLQQGRRRGRSPRAGRSPGRLERRTASRAALRRSGSPRRRKGSRAPGPFGGVGCGRA